MYKYRISRLVGELTLNIDLVNAIDCLSLILAEIAPL